MSSNSQQLHTKTNLVINWRKDQEGPAHNLVRHWHCVGQHKLPAKSL